MTAIIETSKFSDGRLMLRVRFRKDAKNVRQEGNEITWVPAYYEVDLINESLLAVEEYNAKKGKYDKYNDTEFS